MSFAKKLTTATLLGLTALALSGAVLADETFTWAFESDETDPNSDCTANCGSNSGASDYKTFVATGDGTPATMLGVTATAWSNTGGSNNAVAAGQVTRWGGGLGVCNAGTESAVCSTSPDHAVDNNINYDLVMFAFDEPVALTEIQMGWHQTDADISLLAYNGPPDVPVLAGVDYSAGTEGFTAGNVWEVVDNADVDGRLTAINAGEKSSKYWVVAAYNQQFGTCDTCQDPTQRWTDGKYYPDYFKIGLLSGKTVPGTPPTGEAPAPSPLLLTILGGMLLAARSRWQRQA